MRDLRKEKREEKEEREEKEGKRARMMTVRWDDGIGRWDYTEGIMKRHQGHHRHGLDSR